MKKKLESEKQMNRALFSLAVAVAIAVIHMIWMASVIALYPLATGVAVYYITPAMNVWLRAALIVVVVFNSICQIREHASMVAKMSAAVDALKERNEKLVEQIKGGNNNNSQLGQYLAMLNMIATLSSDDDDDDDGDFEKHIQPFNAGNLANVSGYRCPCEECSSARAAINEERTNPNDDDTPPLPPAFSQAFGG